MGFFDFFKRKKKEEKCKPEQPVEEKPKQDIDKYIEATNMTRKEIYLLKSKMLVEEAEKWLHVREMGGDNCGPEVERFQKEVDGKAVGEPWCMSFVQFCVNEVDRKFVEIYHKDFFPNWLFKTEHCLTCWNKSKRARLDLKKLHPGIVVIWQHFKKGKGTSHGHVGIVKELLSNGDMITIEGNTHSHSSSVVREGDGVYQVNRTINFKHGRMRVKGFLQCWDGYNREK